MRQILRFLATVAATGVTVVGLIIGSLLLMAQNSDLNGGGGDVNIGLLNGLYCQLAGCTMTGTITYASGATGFIQVRDAAATLLDVGAAGTGYFAVVSTEPRIRVSSSSISVAQFMEGANAAAALATPTDTATSPANALVSNCRISSTGVSAWTPQESNARDGMILHCVNTGANAITMTDSPGVYEGGAAACVLGQWDSVTFHYSSDRWVEDACRDN